MKPLLMFYCAFVTLASACGVFAVKQGQCYKYCLEFDAPQVNEPAALCYGSQAELETQKAAYAAKGIKLHQVNK